ILESKVSQIPDPLGEENAIEVVELVLHHAGVKALYGALDLRAVLVEATIVQATIARHETAHPRHRQASFPTLILLGSERRHKWIHQHGVGHGRDVRIARVVVELEYHHAATDPDLRGRDTGA